MNLNLGILLLGSLFTLLAYLPSGKSSFMRRVLGEKKFCLDKFEKCMGERHHPTKSHCAMHISRQYACSVHKTERKRSSPQHTASIHPVHAKATHIVIHSKSAHAAHSKNQLAAHHHPGSKS